MTAKQRQTSMLFYCNYLHYLLKPRNHFTL